MAGFAVVMTLFFLGVGGIVTASILSACFVIYAKRKLSHEARKGGVTVFFAMAPFLGFFWLIAAFVMHVWISNHLAHQDCGLGLSPNPWVTLANGYQLGSHNTYDGYISAPGVKTAQPVVGDGYVRSIIKIQWKEPYFIGTQYDFNTGHTRGFVHDTRTRTTTTSDPDLNVNEITADGSKNLDAWAAAQTQVHFEADSYWVMYAQNRHAWPNFVFLALILLGEGAIGFCLWRIFSAASIKTAEEVAG